MVTHTVKHAPQRSTRIPPLFARIGQYDSNSVNSRPKEFPDRPNNPAAYDALIKYPPAQTLYHGKIPPIRATQSMHLRWMLSLALHLPSARKSTHIFSRAQDGPICPDNVDRLTAPDTPVIQNGPAR